MSYKKITGIYMIKCKINNKVYIGQSKNIKKRFSYHRSALNRNNHDNDLLQNDWNKYGQDYFEFNIIVECEEHKLNELEREYINEYKSCDFSYNMTFGKDENGAEIYTEETKKKMSEVRKGKQHTEETKKKISESKMGHEVREETRKKISESKTGYNHTEETKKKMSKNHPDFSGSKNPKANMVICIYPNGTQTEPMCIKELAQYLGLDRGIVGRIINNSEIYHPRNKKHKHLEGIKIIKVEEGLF